jgi:hypothetical protein
MIQNDATDNVRLVHLQITLHIVVLQFARNRLLILDINKYA